MMCLQYYDLEYEIINAKPTEILDPTETQIKRTKGLYNVNEPQARAILSAVTNSGFTLIQGYVISPPCQSYSKNIQPTWYRKNQDGNRYCGSSPDAKQYRNDNINPGCS